MIYGGFDFSPWLHIKPTRALAPSVSVETQEVPGRDGGVFVRTRLEPLSIPVFARLTLKGRQATEDVRRMLAGKLISGEPKELYLPNDPERCYMAVLDGSSELDTLWQNAAADLTFLAPDPVAYGKTRSVAMGTSAVFNVGGNRKTYPRITWTAANVDFVQFTMPEKGVYLRLETEFSAGGKLVIDCSDGGHCTLNGANADDILTLDSDYFEFEPGVVQLTASSGTAIVEWRERWL